MPHISRLELMRSIWDCAGVSDDEGGGDRAVGGLGSSAVLSCVYAGGAGDTDTMRLAGDGILFFLASMISVTN